MSRRVQRWLSILFLFAVSGLLIYLGFDGWAIGGWLPCQYLGYVFICVGLLGAAGVNIWAGGPLDKRVDPPE